LLWLFYVSNVLLPKPLPDVLLEFLKNRAIDRTLAVFQRGAGLEGWEDVDSHATIPRPELIGELKKFIRSYPYIVFFNVEGCGKSTAIRQACRGLDPAGGVVYFHVPLNQKDFAKELAAVLGMTSPNDWGLLSEVLNRPNDIACPGPPASGLIRSKRTKPKSVWRIAGTSSCTARRHFTKYILYTTTKDLWLSTTPRHN